MRLIATAISAMLLLALASFAQPALAASDALVSTPCTLRYPSGLVFDNGSAALLGPSAYFLPAGGAQPGEQVIDISVRKDSINPKSNKTPSGMNFRWRPAVPASAVAACLTYKLQLPHDFAFNKGGKLPGLFGGDGPAGGRKADGSTGFSVRYMWRNRGAGEIYAYLPGHPSGRGQTMDRGAWTFPRGQWVELAMEVVLNAPHASDGSIRVWVDGSLKLNREGIALRTAPELGFTGVMADIFYGGKDKTWAAPADVAIRITPFDLRWR